MVLVVSALVATGTASTEHVEDSAVPNVVIPTEAPRMGLTGMLATKAT